MRRLRRLSCGLAVALLAACAGDPPVPPAVPVRTVVPAPSQPQVRQVSAALLPPRHLLVTSPLAGRLIEGPPPVGTPVRTGELLARLDPEPYRQELIRCRAKYQQVLSDVRRQEGRRLDHLAPIADRSHLASQERQARLAVEQARQDLSATRITAPIAGLVAGGGVADDHPLAPGDTVTTVDIVRPLAVAVHLAENDAIIGVGKDLRVNLFGAAVPVIERREAEDGVVLVVHLDRDRAELPPEPWMAAVQLPGEAGLWIPDGAIQTAAGRSWVWIFEATTGHAKRRTITIGSIAAGRIRVLHGLSPGERVVLDPPLMDGASDWFPAVAEE